MSESQEQKALFKWAGIAEQQFPEGFDNGIRLKDILEKEVAEKFYVNEEKAKTLICEYKGNIHDFSTVIPCLTPDRLKKRQNGRRFKENDDPMFTLTSQDRHGILQIGLLDIKGNEQVRRVYGANGISPCLNTMQGGNRQPKVLENIYG
ncbi:hypothetical protein [uncultured Clostridium sp.]|uniref:hypothetical protein n=1 Tax=uncultured Clostridium sp. TaxID=59620 RepID=UPI00345225AC